MLHFLALVSVTLALLTSSVQSYQETLTQLKSSLDELLSKHDELVRMDQVEEAANLRTELESLHMQLYRLKQNGLFPLRKSSSQFSSSPRSYNNVEIPKGIPDEYRKHIQDNLRDSLEGGGGGGGFADRPFLSGMKKMGPRGSAFPAAGGNVDGDGDFKSMSRSDRFVSILRRRVDDMKRRVDMCVKKDSSKAIELKLDIEKYYLKEVEVMTISEEESSRIFGISQEESLKLLHRHEREKLTGEGSGLGLSGSGIESGIGSGIGLGLGGQRKKHYLPDIGSRISDPSSMTEALVKGGASVQSKRQELQILRVSIMQRIKELEQDIKGDL